ncbi:MAG: hypothetical protein M1321_01380 [Candidatus Marsarchaeota archaeon]|nr:hypothetical protein [Candidatus Marsarchaeota archaeon]
MTQRIQKNRNMEIDRDANAAINMRNAGLPMKGHAALGPRESQARRGSGKYSSAGTAGPAGETGTLPARNDAHREAPAFRAGGH